MPCTVLSGRSLWTALLILMAALKVRASAVEFTPGEFASELERRFFEAHERALAAIKSSHRLAAMQEALCPITNEYIDQTQVGIPLADLNLRLCKVISGRRDAIVEFASKVLELCQENMDSPYCGGSQEAALSLMQYDRKQNPSPNYDAIQNQLAEIGAKKTAKPSLDKTPVAETTMIGPSHTDATKTPPLNALGEAGLHPLASNKKTDESLQPHSSHTVEAKGSGQSSLALVEPSTINESIAHAVGKLKDLQSKATDGPTAPEIQKQMRDILAEPVKLCSGHPKRPIECLGITAIYAELKESAGGTAPICQLVFKLNGPTSRQLADACEQSLYYYWKIHDHKAIDSLKEEMRDATEGDEIVAHLEAKIRRWQTQQETGPLLMDDLVGGPNPPLLGGGLFGYKSAPSRPMGGLIARGGGGATTLSRALKKLTTLIATKARIALASFTLEELRALSDDEAGCLALVENVAPEILRAETRPLQRVVCSGRSLLPTIRRLADGPVKRAWYEACSLDGPSYLLWGGVIIGGTIIIAAVIGGLILYRRSMQPAQGSKA